MIDGGDHHPQLVDHADGRDDRVEREDDVEQHDLDDHAGERRARRGRRVLLLPFELLVDLEGALAEQEQAAADQNQIAAGDGVAEQREERRRSAATIQASENSSRMRVNIAPSSPTLRARGC